MFKFLLKAAFVLSLAGLIIGGLAFGYYYQDLPNIEDLEKQDAGKQVVEVNFSNSENIANFGDLYHNEVRFFELPQNLINAIVATEDRKFFTHGGVDPFAIIRASYVNHRAGRIVQGGSTITQQLAKLLFLSPERTFKRKIQEVILAIKLEKRLTKEQILTTYLNRAYFGAGNYGITSAAKFYFGKEVSQLNLKESALLAGLLKAPSKLSPKNSQENALDRTNVVLSNMIDAGYLDDGDLNELDKDIYYKTNRAQRLYFADYVNEQYADYLEKSDQKKTLTITTTLDKYVQERLEAAVNKFSDDNAKRLQKSQISVVVMEKTGAIVGMIGGKDYQKSQYNRAVYAKRQAGSAFKTFVYLAAFEAGMAPDDKIEDKKINIGTWLPDNYDGKYFGEVTLKEGFAKSLNSVSIQLAQKVGTKEIAKLARKLGISSEIKANDLTISLGTTEVSLLELTTAYASIANDTKPVIPYSVLSIEDSERNILYQAESSEFDEITSTSSQKYIREILRAVIEDGTGKKADFSSSIYGKTGTSQDFRDAWFLGFDDRYIVGVWIGNDDNSPTANIVGGSLPAELFAKIISKI